MVKTAPADNTEQRILDAARNVFLRKGMDGARMQDIADEAGINKALLHYYFRNKEKLFQTIFREMSAGFMPQIFSILESDNTLFEKITELAEAYIVQMSQTPYLPIFILSEVNRHPETMIKKIWGGRKPPIQRFVAQVDEEVRKGNVKPMNPMQLLMNIFSLCIFPFVVRPVFQSVGGMDRRRFDQLIEDRKKEVPRFIIDAIRAKPE